MDRRSFFAAFIGALTGGLVVEAVRASAAYEAPRLTYIGRVDIRREFPQTDPAQAAERFEAALQQLNTSLPTFGDCPRISIDDIPGPMFSRR